MTPTIKDLSRRLIAIEAARAPSDGPVVAAVRSCDRLGGALARLAGTVGSRSLLARALVLAKADVPELGSVQLGSDGALEGFDAVDCGEAAMAVVVQLIGLLVTFIGETLTLSLVRDAWPDAPVDESDRRGEGHL